MRAGAVALLAFVAAADMARSSDVELSGPRPDLTTADVDARLDGYLPYALAQADIAGAVVVIVKDGLRQSCSWSNRARSTWMSM
jgi:hypothetical protein